MGGVEPARSSTCRWARAHGAALPAAPLGLRVDASRARAKPRQPLPVLGDHGRGLASARAGSAPPAPTAALDLREVRPTRAATSTGRTRTTTSTARSSGPTETYFLGRTPAARCTSRSGSRLTKGSSSRSLGPVGRLSAQESFAEHFARVDDGDERHDAPRRAAVPFALQGRPRPPGRRPAPSRRVSQPGRPAIRGARSHAGRSAEVSRSRREVHLGGSPVARTRCRLVELAVVFRIGGRSGVRPSVPWRWRGRGARAGPLPRTRHARRGSRAVPTSMADLRGRVRLDLSRRRPDAPAGPVRGDAGLGPWG